MTEIGFNLIGDKVSLFTFIAISIIDIITIVTIIIVIIYSIIISLCLNNNNLFFSGPGRVVDLMRMLKVPVHTRCNVPVIVLRKPLSSTSLPVTFLPPVKNINENENENENGNENEKENENENENKNEDRDNVYISDITNNIDDNDALNSYTEQIICIPPYVTQEHSKENLKEHSYDTANDLISVEIYFHI